MYAKIEDPGQTPLTAVGDLVLQCLAFIHKRHDTCMG